MSWLFFAVATYALYSIDNFMGKFLIEKKIRHASTVTILGGFFSFIVGFIIFAIRGFHLLPPGQTALLLFSGILLTLYLIPYFNALSLDDASRVIPLFQFVPIFTLIIAYIFLHESLTSKQFIGFIFLTLGGFILGTKKIEKKLFSIRTSFWYMMAACLIYAFTGIIFKYIADTDFWLNVSYQTMGIGIGSLLLLLYKVYRTNFIKEVYSFPLGVFGIIAANSAIALLAEFSYFFAISLAPVTLVSVVQGVQPLFLLTYGLILTLWFPHIIKEDIRKETLGLKLVSIVLLFVGIYYIYL